MLTQGFQGQAEEAGCAQCFGMVLAADSAATGDGIALEFAGLLVLAEGSQGEAEVAVCDQCDDVVLAQDSEAVGAGVVVELPGLLIITERPTAPRRGRGLRTVWWGGPHRGEVCAHFADIYGASVSKKTISRITDDRPVPTPVDITQLAHDLPALEPR